MRLSPRARVGAQPFYLGWAYFCKRQFDVAARHLRTAIQEQPRLLIIHRALAACYAHMGRLSEAREVIERLRLMGPVIVRRPSSSRKPEDRELMESGLRLAMGETE